MKINRTSKGFVLCLAILMIVVSACKKEGTGVTPVMPLTMAQKLTGTTWKNVGNSILNNDNSVKQAIPADGSTEVFNADGTFTVAGGTNPGTGTWVIPADGLSLNINDPNTKTYHSYVLVITTYNGLQYYQPGTYQFNYKP